MRLRLSCILFFVFFGALTTVGQMAGSRKNVLIIMTDEQSADAMSAVIGAQYLRTPNMDKLVKTGIRFSRAYCANPLCTPSRSSMFTGRYPHELGIMDNEPAKAVEGFSTMGTFFSASGYETGYVGKWHIPAIPLKDASRSGFQWIENNQLGGGDSLLAGSAAKFINKKRTSPFLLVVSYINPHNICEWARGDKLPDGDIGMPASLEECPPLLPNHLPTLNETDINRDMRTLVQANPKFQVGNFTTEQWRQYRWAYYRLVEKVDRYIGNLMNVLKASGKYDDTLIVFLSDHGDMQGAHQWNQKTVFYEEASRVPFVLSGPGINPGTSSRLINTGVDLIPTVAAFAGIEIPNSLPGCNVLKPGTERYVVVSNKISVGKSTMERENIKPEGRMVRTENYKYWIYDAGKQRESLFDMNNDPGEMKDLAQSAKYKEVLQQHRQYLKEWAEKYNDKAALNMLQF